MVGTMAGASLPIGGPDSGEKINQACNKFNKYLYRNIQIYLRGTHVFMYLFFCV